MKIGYLRLDHGEWTNGAYNLQEVGLARAFEELGHHVIIFYCVYPDDSRCGQTVELSKNIKKCYLAAKSFGHHALLNLKQLDAFDLDLLHIQGDNLLKVPAAVSYCKKRNLPCYCYVGRLDSEKSGKIHQLMANVMVKRNIKVYRKCLTFTKTPTVKKELDPKGNLENIIVAPVGLDTSIIPEITQDKEELREVLQLPLDATVITCVCGLREGKRPYDIFKLTKILDTNSYFVFIGGWDEDAENAFRDKIKEQKLECRFRYINLMANTEIHSFYVASDFLVNFNPNEIFGMAILEAMYQRLTVIARHAPGPDFIIENGKSGYLVDSVEEMATIISKAKPCGSQARQRIQECFQWSSTAKRILEKI